MNDKENSYYPLLTKGYGKTYITELLEEKNNKIDELQSNWNSLREWLEDENNQKYSKYIYNYSINNWVLDKMNELEGKDKE